MRIALVHDYLVQYGGAERVLECFMEIWPNAPIYTLIYDPSKTHGIFDKKRIYTSFLQKMPFSKENHRIFPPLMPLAIEQFDLSKYDIVLSDSSSFAKGIITGPETLHVSYCHTPMRYAWDDCQKYIDEFAFPKIVKRFVPFAMNYIRLWDRFSAERVDRYVANSHFVATRIKKYYKKNSLVINPPVNVDKFYVDDEREDYFLAVGRLITYKRFDIVIEAFNKLGWNLHVIGRGPDLEKLEGMAKPNIKFLGRISDEALARQYAKCRAFILPQEEDFGIVAIEAMASGRPLVAFRGGDIVEHLAEGETGVFFDEQTPESLIDALEKFDDKIFNPKSIREKAKKFDREIFKTGMQEYINQQLDEFQKKRHDEAQKFLKLGKPLLEESCSSR